MIVLIPNQLLLALMGAYKIRNKPKRIHENPSDTRYTSNESIYENSEYHIMLKYPSSWIPNYHYNPPKYEGYDGYFQIGAIMGEGNDLDTVTRYDITHDMRPYGLRPTVREITVDGREGRIITPSRDQATQLQELSAIIVRYPEPILFDDEVYKYFILWANETFIEEIGESLRFI